MTTATGSKADTREFAQGRASGQGGQKAAVGPLVAASVLGAALLWGAPAAAQATVDTLTCAAAQRYVQANGSYNKKTGFGVLPIRPVQPNSNAPNCGPRQYPSFFLERTLDNPSCNLGYSCQTRDIR